MKYLGGKYMFLLSTQGWAIIMLCICILPIGALIIAAIVLRVKKSFKRNKDYIEVEENQITDEEQIKLFKDAYGGEDNIDTVSIERNKISVVVKDPTLVQGEKLQELGASGVLIVGNEVRSSFGDRASSVYDLIK